MNGSCEFWFKLALGLQKKSNLKAVSKEILFENVVDIISVPSMLHQPSIILGK